MTVFTDRYGRAIDPIPTPDAPEYLGFPFISVTLPDDAKVSGALEIQFQGDAVHVGTEGAHVNDDNLGLVFRGEGFLASMHAYRNAETGEWEAGEYPAHATRRDNWSDATPTMRKALVAAMLAAVNDVASVSPEFVEGGHYARAMQALASDARELRELDEKRAEVKARMRKATREARDHRPAR